jgi:hypothetical protein
MKIKWRGSFFLSIYSAKLKKKKITHFAAALVAAPAREKIWLLAAPAHVQSL